MAEKQTKIDSIIDKIYSILNRELQKPIKAKFTYNKILDIDLEIVKKLKSEYGIGGIILDVDQTIRTEMSEIPECNKKWIEFMKEQFKIILLSNGACNKVREYAKAQKIEYIAFAQKPLKKNILGACNKMGLEPENVLMIGDDSITDIFGGNRSGVLTAIVKDVQEDYDEREK